PRSQNAGRLADRRANDCVSVNEKGFEKPLSQDGGFYPLLITTDDFARKSATTSISAVCGNMSSGVTDSMMNLSCKSLKSRASVGGLHETYMSAVGARSRIAFRTSALSPVAGGSTMSVVEASDLNCPLCTSFALAGRFG